MQTPFDQNKQDADRKGRIPSMVAEGAGVESEAQVDWGVVIRRVAFFDMDDAAEQINGECYGRRQRTGYVPGWTEKCATPRAKRQGDGQ